MAKSPHATHPVRSVDPTFKARSRPTLEILRRVAVYLPPYPFLAAGTVLCAVLSLGSSLVYPKLAHYVVNDVLGHRQASLLTPVILGVIGAFLLRDLFNSLRIRINNTL